MPLKTCAACGKEVSTNAAACPHCGEPSTLVKVQRAGTALWKIGCLILLLIILIPLLLGTCAGFFSETMKQAGVSPPPRVSAPPRAATTVSAVILMRDYNTNEVNADNIYKGRTIRVQGQVASIGKDIVDHMYITLEAGQFVFNVQCMFPDTANAQLASMRAGTWVSITGQCAGKLGNVLLRDCILEPGAVIAVAETQFGAPPGVEIGVPLPPPAPLQYPITLAKFNQIKTGMSYREVARILGCEGVVQSESVMPVGRSRETRMVSYSWDAGEMASMSASFQDDRLTDKSQFGLK